MREMMTNEKERRAFNWRVFIAELLLWTLLVDAVSGFVLYTPGHFAHGLRVRPLGLDIGTWAAWHTVVGFLLILAFAYHAVLNWRPLLAYLQGRRRAWGRLRLEFLAALAFTVYLVVATVYYWPPVSQVWNFRTTLNAVWAYRVLGGETVAELAKQRRQPLERVLSRFEKYHVDASGEETLAEVAKRSGYTVYDLYQIARGRSPVTQR